MANIRGGGDLAAGRFYAFHGEVHPLQIIASIVPGGVFQAHADMAAVLDSFFYQRLDTDQQTGDHPGRIHRHIRQQRQIGLQAKGLWRKAETVAIGEHEAVNRLGRVRKGPFEGRAGAGETGFIDGITCIEPKFLGQLHGREDVGIGVLIQKAGLVPRDTIQIGQIDGARINRHPFQ